MPNSTSFILVRILAYIAVPLASFLTFMVQPLVGKHLLPWHGGSASTWVTSMVFFQAALLGGYLIAYYLQRISLVRQAMVVAVLAIFVPLVTQIPPIQVGAVSGAGAVLLSLACSLLPAVLLTTSLGILMHGWFRAFGRKVPYYLYSISNFGSLAALCSYPFLIEPKIGLAVQGRGFMGLLLLLSGLALWLSYLTWRHARRLGTLAAAPEAEAQVASGAAPEDEVIGLGRKLYWFVLSAAACVAMIGTMRVLSSEIGSNPVSWVVPLAVYLLSFSLTFSGLWRSAFNPLLTAALAIALFAWIYHKGLTLMPVDFKLMGLLIAVLFLATHLAHGLVYLLRPKQRFEVFYVVIASGGVFGGFFASVSAPSIFSQAFEFPGALLLILGFGAWELLKVSDRPPQRYLRKIAVVVAVLIPGFFILQQQVAVQVTDTSRLRHLRSLYGQFPIDTRPQILRAISETTIHGTQWRDEARRQMATTYYHKGTGLGRILTRMQENRETLNIGVVGLGVGTLAAYGREGDRIIFWDIDPSTFFIAGQVFSFVSESAAEVEFRLRDGRLGVQESVETFDLLVIDAFSGDSIPPHLLTREAIEVFLERVPQGVLAVHVSNRFIEVFPVLATHALELGVEGVWIWALPDGHIRGAEGATAAKYFFFLPAGSPFDDASLRDLLGEGFDHFNYQYRVASEMDPEQMIHWTDDRHAIMDVWLDSP